MELSAWSGHQIIEVWLGPQKLPNLRLITQPSVTAHIIESQISVSFDFLPIVVD